MTKLLLRALFFLLPFLYSVYLAAQPGNARDCGTTCFSSEVVTAEKLAGGCTSYAIKVSYSGACAHALSHYSLEVPCGAVQNLWNSAAWKQEIGTDPTTGISGFKIDDISGFGEGAMKSFTVTFTLCPSDGNCEKQLACWQPVVAYKAGTCVNYQTLDVSCQRLAASLEKNDASCFGASDGSLTVVVDEGSEPYTFLWSDHSTSATRTGLTAGDYSVTVRDASGAEITLAETIAQPQAISLSGAALPATCNGMANGSVDLTVSGGTAPYTFSWSDGAESEDLSAVPAGTYAVTVKDASGCAVTNRFTVGTTIVMDVSSTHVKPDCSSANGSIDISVAGGTAPYAFSWSNGATTEDLTAIPAGLYSVVITDAGGCSKTASYFIKENNTLKIAGSASPANCTDDASGAIDLTVTGGTAPYSYDWSDGATTEDLTLISSGYYTVRVTDSKGCTATAGFAVSKSTFQVPRVVTQPTCYGENDGAIALQEPIGGTGPFTYAWSSQNETGTALTGLEPGIYTVTVTDATGCSRTLSSTIHEPSAIVATATVSSTSCNAEGSFSIDLNASGGTAPYSFQWSDGSTTEDPSGLESGTYTVVITDAHGCSTSKDVVIEAAATWSCMITAPATAPVCGSTGNSLTSQVSDADSYSWAVESSDGVWALENTGTQTVSYRAGGENSSATFTLTVTKDGCTQTCSVTLNSCTSDDEGGSDGGEPDGETPGDGTDGGSTDDGENAGGETPGGDNNGGELPDGEVPDEDSGQEDCETCFDTEATVTAISATCRTYEMVVSTTGFCSHELSHWTIAIPCGTVRDYSNSRGWKMEFGEDPTTGVYGLKVDNIGDFGKAADAFTVRFTICGEDACDLTSWAPVAAYKAGRCVDFESVPIPLPVTTESGARVSAYPNPFTETINFRWEAATDDVHLQIIDQYGNTLSTVTNPTGKEDDYYIAVQTADLPHGMYYYRLTVGGKTFQGKISKQ